MESDRPLKNQIILYLLGEMSEPERLRIEEQYFANPDFLLNLRAAYDDLTDAWLCGEMSEPERQKFEQQLRTHPWLREKAATDQALRQLLRTEAQHITQPTASGWPTGRRLGTLFRLMPHALAAVIMVLLGGATWYATRNSRITQQTAQTHLATLSPPPEADQPLPSSPQTPAVAPATSATPAAQPSSAAPKPAIATFFLSADLVRGDESVPTLIIPARTSTVPLWLELAEENTRFYQAVLQQRSGETVQIWHRLPLQVRQQVPVVALRLPAELLAATDYVIRLSSQDSAQETVPLPQYYFCVERR
jgi:hypothetical protein